MTSIMKQMHSPGNFAGPEMTLPGSKPSGFHSMMANKHSMLGTSRPSNNSPRTSVKGNYPRNKFIGDSP